MSLNEREFTVSLRRNLLLFSTSLSIFLLANGVDCMRLAPCLNRLVIAVHMDHILRGLTGDLWSPKHFGVNGLL